VAGIQKEIFNVKDITDAWRGKVAEHIVGQELLMDEVEHQTAIRIWSGKFSIDKITTPKGKSFNLYNIPFYYAGVLENLLDKIG
jgi:hypothetical protein